MLSVLISPRDFADGDALPGVALTVGHYDWSVYGGPRACSLSARGAASAIWTAFDALRCPVTIRDELYVARWWGFVSSVIVSLGGFRFSLSLDGMWNKVAVSYTVPQAGLGVLRGLTSWSEDSDSQAEYGVKELIEPMTDTDATGAAQRAAALLALYKRPVRSLATLGGGVNIPTLGLAGDVATLWIGCRGWWDTLSWKHYSNPADSLFYIDEGAEFYAWGDAAAREKVVQQITLADNCAWTASRVKLHVRKYGSPSDNLTLDLCADSSGPGAVLATCTVAGSAADAVGAWLEFSLSAGVSLTYGTYYWLVLRRSGGADASNYYGLTVTQALGATGVFRVYNGASWGAVSPDVDAMYIVTGNDMLEAQIAAHIAAAGQFLTATDCDVTTGVSTSSYRDNVVAQRSIETLMGAGESSGKCRLMTTVSIDRRVRLGAQPARGASDWTLDTNGVLRDSDGCIQPPRACPVGMWVIPSLPASINSMMADPGAYFVESASYLVDSDAWQPDFLSPVRDVPPLTLPGEGAGRWEVTRQLVLRRDGYKCVRCGKTAEGSGAPLEVHHIVPRSIGGSDNLLNLVTLCQPCHSQTSSYGESLA